MGVHRVPGYGVFAVPRRVILGQNGAREDAYPGTRVRSSIGIGFNHPPPGCPAGRGSP